MENLLKAIYQKDDFEFFSAPEYIGKNVEKIISQHPVYNKIPHIDKNEEAYILEIRVENSTLSCVIKNEVCTEANIFPD